MYELDKNKTNVTWHIILEPKTFFAEIATFPKSEK